jgi:hypothetical protein
MPDAEDGSAFAFVLRMPTALSATPGGSKPSTTWTTRRDAGQQSRVQIELATADEEELGQRPGRRRVR